MLRLMHVVQEARCEQLVVRFRSALCFLCYAERRSTSNSRVAESHLVVRRDILTVTIIDINRVLSVRDLVPDGMSRPVSLSWALSPR